MHQSHDLRPILDWPACQRTVQSAAYNKLQLDLVCWPTGRPLPTLAQNCPLSAREKTSDRPRFSCRSYGELTYQRFVASKRFSIDQYIAVSIGGQASLRPCLDKTTKTFAQKDECMHEVLNEVYL